MSLEKLPKIVTKSKKRVGRGYGSGKGGHTTGRGAKGQKIRTKIPLTFEGTKMKKSLFKRLPLMRGKGKFKSFRRGPIVVNVKYLNLLPNGSKVNAKTLAQKGIVNEQEANQFGIKVLGDGELKVALEVEIRCSKGAAKKIQKAGGKVIVSKK